MSWHAVKMSIVAYYIRCREEIIIATYGPYTISGLILGLRPSQWETALHCNDVSHWLGANLESALQYESDLQVWD